MSKTVKINKIYNDVSVKHNKPLLYFYCISED